uniref:Adenylate kinase 5 n=1 Tax=Anas zonorhyncha TaxID=75864 RepID=A0A8B9VBM9_9AVES
MPHNTVRFHHLCGPGSGKGSQCEQLVKKYGFTHLSTGDLLQNELSSLSERSKLIKDIMECGEPVPGGIVLELLKEAMVANLGDTKGFLIDGYPRELNEAKEFESKIGEPKLVFCLDCSAETMSSRLLMRSQSSQHFDSAETIKEGIESYYQAAKPVIAYYEKKPLSYLYTADSVYPEIKQTCTQERSFSWYK